MGQNKHYRKRVTGLQAKINLHEQKIAFELQKAEPDAGLIQHWSKEIRGWQNEIGRLQRRLPQKRK
ncbi:MAG TPA: hypothetical protein VJ464_08290 [Blastocatellia bacterium]|nr:hypothetical protein [Blastocatellia bacterium]